MQRGSFNRQNWEKKRSNKKESSVFCQQSKNPQKKAINNNKIKKNIKMDPQTSIHFETLQLHAG